MTTFERDAQLFGRLYDELKNSPRDLGEADTRVKIIDAILAALGWPESAIRREEHVHAGYLDYVLQAGIHRLIVEAKRIEHAFVLPAGMDFGRYLTVKNLLERQRDLRLMYDQVTRYAHERSIPFCVLTNGLQWLVFPGVRSDNIHLRHSRVVVFNGLTSLSSNFLDLWNLLSYEAVSDGSLPAQILEPTAHVESSFLFNSEGRTNVPYDRNHLSLPLQDILPKYFGDLQGDPAHTELLRECFVQDSPVDSAVRTLLGTSESEAPSATLSVVGPVMHFYSLPLVSKKLEAVLRNFIADPRDTHFQVIVGRVGIGKTTFLAHFFDVDFLQLSREHYIVRLDLQGATESTDLDQFFNTHLWETLRNHERFSALTSPATLKQVYWSEISVLEKGVLAPLKRRSEAAFEEEVGRFLATQFADHTQLTRSIARFLSEKRAGRFILVFDNVDQLLDQQLQERVIRFAFAKMKELHAFAILSMWEETYFGSKRAGNTLSTMRTVPLQITRQSITSVLVKRLEYCLRQIRNGGERLALLNPEECDRDTFCAFVELILKSLLVSNRRVRMFLELVALGNIRGALDMFCAFLTAGSLETRKILDLMKVHEDYLVPVHEFIKSVMLGSKRYYSEQTSDMVNMFAIGDVENPSHFTRLRILHWLFQRRHDGGAFGPGLVPLAEASRCWERTGISRKDASVSIKRLTEGGLVENDLRARKLMDSAQAVRITGAGRYYLRGIYRTFAYYDLAMQDTPLFDRNVFDEVERLCESTDIPVRVERCEKFLAYLEDQEEEELLAIEKLDLEPTWHKRFVPAMKSDLEATRRRFSEKGYL